ncbi:hypothetical protein HY256_04960 [Candidatus Sumerlaeota bacterium]|nr:hypothetical protein [Candidatus Sumerlaeota bacterium]
MLKPHCPECKSTSKPHSKITGLKGERVLIVYCSDCGCMVGAVPYTQPREPQSEDGHDTGESGGN